MATNKLTQQTCEAIVATVAETIALNYINYFRITNTSGQALYVKFDWDTGDTEVSATNFDIYLANLDYAEFQARTPTWPKLRNMRVISAGTGRVAVLGW